MTSNLNFGSWDQTLVSGTEFQSCVMWLLTPSIKRCVVDKSKDTGLNCEGGIGLVSRIYFGTQPVIAFARAS